MKYLLNRKIPNAFSILIIVLCIASCFSVYAEDPEVEEVEAISQVHVDLIQCASNNAELIEYIKAFQSQILQTCQSGGVIEALNERGDRVLFYCSKATEL